jgi:hypothetical protein
MRLVPSNIGVAARMTTRSGSVPVTLLTNALRARFPCEIRDHRVGPFSPSVDDPVSDVRLMAEEVPVAFSYESASYAVMMATPADLTDFAVGFSLNEGTVSAAGDIESLDIIETDGTLLRGWLSGLPAAAFWERRRYLAGPRLSSLLLIDESFPQNS